MTESNNHPLTKLCVMNCFKQREEQHSSAHHNLLPLSTTCFAKCSGKMFRKYSFIPTGTLTDLTHKNSLNASFATSFIVDGSVISFKMAS